MLLQSDATRQVRGALTQIRSAAGDDVAAACCRSPKGWFEMLFRQRLTNLVARKLGHWNDIVADKALSIGRCEQLNGDVDFCGTFVQQIK